MTDTLSSVERSARMRLIRGRDTKPEMQVRRLVHGLGYRYRLHRRDLAGTPDLVFGSRRAAIFVHGCFWHRHSDPDCHLARLPKSRTEFWLPKLSANRIRDERNENILRDFGWRVMVIWECELADEVGLAARIAEYMNGGDGHARR